MSKLKLKNPYAFPCEKAEAGIGNDWYSAK